MVAVAPLGSAFFFFLWVGETERECERELAVLLEEPLLEELERELEEPVELERDDPLLLAEEELLDLE